MPETQDFWRHKPLTELNQQEWESLCDGCAKCCLQKLEDEDSSEIYYTNIACRYLDLGICSCTEYQQRTTLVPECVIVTPENIEQLHWMPETCSYRLLYEGKSLPPWHPLLTGNQADVHEAGASVQAYAVSELQLTDPDDPEELEQHIIEWLR